METIKVFIADDHQIIIDGLKSVLEEDKSIEVIGIANNGGDAIERIKLFNIDVVILDIEMPVFNGIEVTRQIREFNRDIKIIILSMYNESGLIKKLSAMGANGYLLKNADQEELITAIKEVHKGKNYFSEQLDDASLQSSAEKITPDINTKEFTDLTEREIEILKNIADGLSNKEIGEKLFISHRTVDTHRTNLMKKLGVNKIAGLIKFAIQNGYVN